jgi:hypothetical protein
VEGGVHSLCSMYEARQQRMNDRDAVVHKVMNAACSDEEMPPLAPKHNENLRSMFFKEVGEVMRKREGTPKKADGSRKDFVMFKRKNLPKDVLVEVYKNLKTMVPRDVIERELMSSCDSAERFYDIQTAFARSMASASIMGWIMGLGDRHPNNLMVRAAPTSSAPCCSNLL